MKLVSVQYKPTVRIPLIIIRETEQTRCYRMSKLNVPL
jgi:hypothetical protein